MRDILPINWSIISHPLNWFIVFFMVVIAIIPVMLINDHVFHRTN